MKEYELLKDLPDLKAGAVFTSKKVEQDNNTVKIVYSHDNGGELHDTFMCWNYLAKNVEDNPDFFKEIVTLVKVLSVEDNIVDGEDAIIVTGTKGMTLDHVRERVESAFAQKAENSEWETPANLNLSKLQIKRIGLGLKKLINEELEK